MWCVCVFLGHMGGQNIGIFKMFSDNINIGQEHNCLFRICDKKIIVGGLPNQ